MSLQVKLFFHHLQKSLICCTFENIEVVCYCVLAQLMLVIVDVYAKKLKIPLNILIVDT